MRSSLIPTPKVSLSNGLSGLHSAGNPRKSPAPTATPVLTLPQMQQPFAPAQTDSVLRWNPEADDLAEVSNVTPRGANGYETVAPSQCAPAQALPSATSTALARRGLNQALVTTGNRGSYDANDLWNSFEENVSGCLTANGINAEETLEYLEQEAAKAKREAQARRKQIPPFVQKLSSFLDESRNTDLIRWSEAGDSFIVLDEDEFAKTLIPELFKHNNYASFVRQLNMYGFHKRVGLSDNSMKASERKNKSPSEYFNPYFRRGHPNLLWLINKPKSGKKKNSNKNGEGDSEDEPAVEEQFAGVAAGYGPGQNTARAAGVGELGPLPKKELVQVKLQLEKMQQQQITIHNMIKQLHQEHVALSQQAAQFQSQHSRHEASINAILTFLADVYRKSLEEGGGPQTVQEIFANLMPNSQVHNQNQIPQRSVLDLDDLFNSQQQGGVPMSPKRPTRLLLPPQRAGKPASVSPPSTLTPGPPSHYPGNYQMGSVTELVEPISSDPSSAVFLHSELENNPQEGMMRIINNTNAGKPSLLVLGGLPGSPTGASSEQHTKFFNNLMAARSSARTTAASAGDGPASIPPLSPTEVPTPVPTPARQPASPAAAVATIGPGTSLSPILGTALSPPHMTSIHATQAGIDDVQRLQMEQDHEISRLAQLIGPISPGVQTPKHAEGVEEGPGDFDLGNFDLNSFVDLSCNNTDFDGSGLDTPAPHGLPDTNDFTFNLDEMTEFVPETVSSISRLEPVHIVGPASAIGTPSTTVTELSRDSADSPEHGTKRRRVR